MKYNILILDYDGLPPATWDQSPKDGRFNMCVPSAEYNGSANGFELESARAMACGFNSREITTRPRLALWAIVIPVSDGLPEKGQVVKIEEHCVSN